MTVPTASPTPPPTAPPAPVTPPPTESVPAVASGTASPSPPPAIPTKAREAQRPWADKHGKGGSLLAKVLWIAAGIAVVLVTTTAIPTRVDPAVVVDVKADGIVFRPDTTLDLVAASNGSVDGAGITLEPPYVHVRADSVTGFSYRRKLPDDGDLAIGAAALQRLVIADGCVVYVDRLQRGWMRVGVLPAQTVGTGERPPCVVRGQVWTGRPSRLAARSRPAAWDSLVPDMQAVEVHATPTAGRPLSLTLRPAAGLRLRRVPITRLSFETREHGPMVESGILGGTIRFPTYDNDIHPVFARDTLSLGESAGTLAELTAGDSTAGDTLVALFRGTASQPRVGPEDLKPNVLEWVYSQKRLRFALGLGVAAFGLIFGVVKDVTAKKASASSAGSERTGTP